MQPLRVVSLRISRLVVRTCSHFRRAPPHEEPSAPKGALPRAAEEKNEQRASSLSCERYVSLIESKPRALARTALVASLSRPPYGSHSGSRHACQKRPTSQCGWTRRAAAQTVVAQRVPGRAGNALLRDRGNESLRRRLSEGAPPRGAHAGDGFIVGGSCSGRTRSLEARS